MTKEQIDSYKKILQGENEPSTMEWVGMVETLIETLEEAQNEILALKEGTHNHV